jgi:hypothetical protein
MAKNKKSTGEYDENGDLEEVEAAPAPAPTPAPASPMGKAMERDRTPYGAGEHPTGSDYRFRVENTAAGDLNQDPREPYPTGSPPDPREEFFKINGFYPGEGGTGGIAGVKKTSSPKE